MQMNLWRFVHDSQRFMEKIPRVSNKITLIRVVSGDTALYRVFYTCIGVDVKYYICIVALWGHAMGAKNWSNENKTKQVKAET